MVWTILETADPGTSSWHDRPIHEDFLRDTGFNIQRYLVDSFAKRMGHTEEPLLMAMEENSYGYPCLRRWRGVGVTTTAITYDDVISLYFSVKKNTARTASG